MKRILSIFLLVLIVVVLDSVALRVSPVEIDVTMASASEASFSLEVTNDEDEELSINVQLCDWLRDLAGNNLFCEDAVDVERSSIEWLSVTPTQFSLEPGASEEIRYTISTPSTEVDGDPLDGSYWTAMMIETAPASKGDEEASEIIVKRRFGIKVYTQITGTGTLRGQVGNLESYGLNPLWVSYDFENLGSLNMKDVTGRIEVRNTGGETVETINIESFPILPGYVHRFSSFSAREAGDMLAPGNYVLLAILDYGGDNQVGAQAMLRIPEISLAPVGEAGVPPNDLDADGFYEDVNGDSQFTLDDSTTLSAHLNDDALQINWVAFDFNNDGVLDFDDVIELRSQFEGEAE